MHRVRRLSVRFSRNVPAVVAALVAALLLGAGLPTPASSHPAAAGCPASTPREVEAIARAYFAAFNSGDVNALDALLDPGYRHQGAVVSMQDRALHLRRLLDVRRGFPDGVFTIEWLFVDGDTAVVRHTFRGTHLGEYTGVPASGRRVAVGAFHVHRVVCGRIAETWNSGDAIGLFRQIGAIPGPATTPADEESRTPATPARPSCPAGSREQNIATARRWYDEVLNQGRFQVLNEILAEDIVHHAAVFVDLVGREPVAGSLRALLTGFPDVQYSVDAVLASDDMVLIRWTGRGTQTGEFLGFPPSGVGVTWSGMNAFRFACGVIVEGWSEANGLDVLRQIGAVP